MTKVDRKIAPKFQLVNNITVPNIEIEKLNNGIPLYFVKTTNKDISEIIFSFEIGVWDQPNLLVASMTKSLIPEGTKFHSSKEIADIFDYCGAHLNTGSGMHASSVKLMTLNKHLEKLVELTAEILKYANFSEKEFEIKRKKHKQQLIIDLEEVEIIARNTLERNIYGEKNPYGWAATPEDYEKLKLEQIKSFFEEKYTSDNLKIIVASNQKEKIIDLLNEHIKDFRKSKKRKNKTNFEKISGEKYQYIPQEDAMQSALRIGWNLFPRKHPDTFDISILDTILGGYFGSRLMQNIRQKKGYTYSIYSAMLLYKYDGTLQIISEIKKDNKEQVLDEIKKEVLRLQNELISKTELDSVKNYVMGTILQGLDGNFTFARTLHSLLNYHLDFDYFQKYTERLKTITPERLQELAKKYLQLENMFTVIAG